MLTGDAAGEKAGAGKKCVLQLSDLVYVCFADQVPSEDNVCVELSSPSLLLGRDEEAALAMGGEVIFIHPCSFPIHTH
jgi:hypothetical protein